MPFLSICFLLIFCPPHHYHSHRTPAVANETPFCRGVIAAYAKSNMGDKEKFVSAFPAGKQDQARACIE